MQCFAGVVTAGGGIARDFALTSRARRAEGSGAVVQLDRFTVASERETDARALATNEQRFASNLKNVMATDELGDVLFQVVFHSILAAEAGAFTFADVARGIHDKLVRRHPHVFGAVEVAGSDADGVVEALGGVLDRAVRRQRIADVPLGVFLSAAALVGVDACPMEGFQADKYDEILGLKDKGLGSVVIAAAGYRSPEDAAAGAAKSRFPVEEVVIRV